MEAEEIELNERKVDYFVAKMLFINIITYFLITKFMALYILDKCTACHN